MLSRALNLATVTLLIGCFAADPGRAQAQNLEAGKSPSQIFAGTCTACHKSPRGLLKTVAPGALPAFLRQHYTTSGDMAGLLSAFLVSNGASDTRYLGTQPKAAKDAKPEAQPGTPADQIDRLGRWLRPPAPLEAAKPEAEPREAAKPNADELAPQAESERHRRNGRRLARPGEPPDAARPNAEGQIPGQTAGDYGPDGRKLTAKQRLSKRGRPGGEEPPKSDAATSDPAKEKAAKSEAAKDDKAGSESAKTESGKPEEARPSAEDSSEPGRGESPKTPGGDAAAQRADPVPPVAPASPVGSAGAASATADPTPSPPPAQTPPPAVTASAPPVAPAGPPAPPISQ